MNRRSLLKTLCALGAALAIPVTGRPRYSVQVFQSRCTGCKDCTRVCPVDAVKIIRKKAFIDTTTCTKCLLCYSTCSYGAIVKCLQNQDGDQ
ncbi:MAG TPA: 4Fe-4S binding protein [Chitinispirillaceae bacterium]|nr:4Fe-4S binding protein [Chitinispirillaceae bacterium]